MSAAQIRFVEYGAVQVSVFEYGAAKVRPAELGAFENGSFQRCVRQPCSADVRKRKVGVLERRLYKHCVLANRPHHEGSAEFGPTEVRVHKRGFTKISREKFRPCQICSVELRLLEF